MERQTGRRVQTIQFVIVSLGQRTVGSVLDNDMTGRAGAVSAAGVLELNPEMEGDVQNRFGLAVLVVRQLPRFKFHGAIKIRERYLRHIFIVTIWKPR